MRKRRRMPGLSYANVVATLALFVALGGASYAALKLPKNSVGQKQLKKNAVNSSKVKNNSLTGADIKLSKLGTVPSAQSAATANTANTANIATTANSANVANTAGVASSLGPSEDWHEVGAPGEPQFQNSWVAQEAYPPVAFYKDHEGIVHLRGVISGGTGVFAFRLPPGYRPASGKSISLAVQCSGGSCGAASVGFAVLWGSGINAEYDGELAVDAEIASLNGIDFRAES